MSGYQDTLYSVCIANCLESVFCIQNRICFLLDKLASEEDVNEWISVGTAYAGTSGVSGVYSTMSCRDRN